MAKKRVDVTKNWEVVSGHGTAFRQCRTPRRVVRSRRRDMLKPKVVPKRAHKAEGSGLQAKLAGVAEVSVGKLIEKPKNGDPVKTRRTGGNAHGPDISVVRKCVDLDVNGVNGKGSGISATENNRLEEDPTASQAIRLGQE